MNNKLKWFYKHRFRPLHVYQKVLRLPKQTKPVSGKETNLLRLLFLKTNKQNIVSEEATQKFFQFCFEIRN